MNIQVNLILNEREYKALSDVLHHELDCSKWFLDDKVYGDDESRKEDLEDRIAVLSYILDEMESK